MYKNFLKWQTDFKPSECDDALFREQLGRGKFFVLSLEDGCNPILYFLPREHDPDLDHYKKVVRFGCYVYELAVRNLSNASTVEFISFVNCNGVGLRNVDRKLIKAGITIYQDYFPERLHSCYVYGLPPALTTIWSFVEKLLDDRTRGKIILLKKTQHKEVFSKFPKELLPPELGGTNETIDKYSRDLVMAMHENRFTEFGKKLGGEENKQVIQNENGELKKQDQRDEKKREKEKWEEEKREKEKWEEEKRTEVEAYKAEIEKVAEELQKLTTQEGIEIELQIVPQF